MPEQENSGIVENTSLEPVESVEAARSSVEETSEGTQSSHGSITHPYRAQLDDTSFARCHLMATSSVGTETYTRSLYMLGHGVPVWDPVGDLNRPKPSLESGIMIGDVGYLTHEGNFFSYFNIFLTAEDALQRRCPPDMVPLSPPPEPSDIMTSPNYFPPGTTLVSKGVEANTISASPLNVSFTVKARESGILVLRDGASREDLLSTVRIRDYVQKHALEWYMFLNSSPSLIPFPNGSLYVVTGHDKAVTWATCTSSSRSFSQAGKSMTIRYQAHVWKQSQNYMAAKRSRAVQNTGKCAVFIRGMRVAVNIRDWNRCILFDQPPPMIPYYNILSVPVIGLRAKLQTLKERHRLYSEKSVICPDRERIFHPLEIILRVLLEESPTSDVAFAEDFMWCRVADSSDCSLPQIIELAARVLETHELSSGEGMVTLMPTSSGPEQDNPSSSLTRAIIDFPNLVGKRYHALRRRRKILNRITKVFPGPAIPEHLLEDDE